MEQHFTVSRHEWRRPLCLIALAVMFAVAAIVLFVSSSPSVTPVPTTDASDSSRWGGGVAVVHERGVNVVLSLRPAGQKGVLGEEGVFELYAAWPRAWERPPLILVVMDDSVTPAKVHAVLRPCRSDSLFVGGTRCHGEYDGEIVELSDDDRSDHSPTDRRVFQLVLNGRETSTSQGELAVRGIARDVAEEPLELLEVPPGSDVVVGGMALKQAPAATVERDGSQARVNLPVVEAGGNFYESVCGWIDCADQRSAVNGVLNRSDFDLTEPQRDALLLRNQPVGDENPRSWVSDVTETYLSARLQEDWTPYGLGPRRIRDWPDAVWRLSDTYASDGSEGGLLSFAVESTSVSSDERTYGFAAAAAAGFSVSLVLLAVEQGLTQNAATARPLAPTSLPTGQGAIPASPASEPPARPAPALAARDGRRPERSEVGRSLFVGALLTALGFALIRRWRRRQ